MERLDEILANEELVWLVMEHYVPAVLISKLGRAAIMTILNSPELQSYRDAIVTKKLASMAFYKFGEDWDAFLTSLDKDCIKSLYKTMK